MNLGEWLKSGKYLPDFMRDFHDQKDLFKCIHQTVNLNGHSAEKVDWITGHIYVIDVFLWWMAKRGYTLQKTRTNLQFSDIHQDIKAADKARLDSLSAFINGDSK